MFDEAVSIRRCLQEVAIRRSTVEVDERHLVLGEIVVNSKMIPSATIDDGVYGAG